MCADKKIELWETVMFILLYLVYVLFVVVSERRAAKTAAETGGVV